VQLSPRTPRLIEALAHEYETQGNVLAACAVMLSRPDPREGLTPAPPTPRAKIVYDNGETAETLSAKDAKELQWRRKPEVITEGHMSYSDGNTPVVGDKVERQRDRKVGTVTHVQLNAPNTPGHDIVSFKPDDGSIGVSTSLAAEYALVSRTKRTVDEDGHDLEWHKRECQRCIEAGGGGWDWCQKAIPLVASEPL
jgi:hypothetical protein